MIWHNEDLIGINAAINAIKRLLPRLKPFGCIKVIVGELSFTVLQKPWAGSVYIVLGKLSKSDGERLQTAARQLGLLLFANAPLREESQGFSFYSQNEDPHVIDACRQLLELFVSGETNIVVQGINMSVNDMQFVPHKE